MGALQAAPFFAWAVFSIWNLISLIYGIRIDLGLIGA